MKKFKNSLVLTPFIFLFSATILLVAPVSNAQQLNHVRAYIAPVDPQKSYFPSEQQVQQALAPRVFVAKQESSFPPLEKQPQAFINQFSTPDAPRTTSMPQFVAPNLMLDDATMPQRYNMPSGDGYAPSAMKFPAAPRSARKSYNNFPPQGFGNSSRDKLFANNFGSKNNGNPFSFPNADIFPAVPFANMNGLPPMTAGNKLGNSFPLMPKTTNSKRKKAWGDKRNIWPDFYTDFTDNAWDETIGAPRKLGRMPGGWRFPYVTTPDPVTVSDAVVNQFPPIADEAGNMGNISKWGVFD